MKSIIGRRNSGAVLLLLAVLCLAVEPAECRTITVQADGNGDYPTIQDAIDDSNDGDVIILAEGIYTGTGNRDIDFLGKAIAVRSTDPNELGVVAATIIDCEGTESEYHRGFYFHNTEHTDSVLDGFTVANGYAPEGGGIKCNNNSNPTIKNCIISGNIADNNGQGGFGGGIYCKNCDPVISNCIIKDNKIIPASSHTGIDGGGIYCYDSDPDLSNCIITNNSAGGFRGHGGGIYCTWLSTPNITNCTFSGNSAEKGGAVHCTYWSGARITNSILWADWASWGNEIYLSNWFGSFPSKVIALYNNIPDGFGNIYREWGCIMEWGEGNIHTDPCFVLAGDVYISADSPCIDVGTNEPEGGLLPTDLEGVPRLLDGDGDGNAVVDMGAYEYTVEPRIFISPRALRFYGPAGGPTPAEQVVGLANAGGGILNWEIVEDCNWLEVSPVTGVSSGEIHETTIRVDTNGMEHGTYTYALEVRDQEAINAPKKIGVTLIIGVPHHFPSEYPTIQAAIDDCNEGDGVVVAIGRYTGDGNRDLDFRGKLITVYSTDPTDPCVVAATIIDCQGTEGNRHRGFCFESGEKSNSVVDGLTIINGHESQGGGIYCNGASPTVRNCIIIGNKATHFGGGIYVMYGDPRIINCMVSANRSGRHAGGIFCMGGTLKIDKSIIRSNSAEESCGGISCRIGSSTITNCIVSGNSSAHGGGLSYYGDNSMLSNCDITGNTTEEKGGGIFSRKGELVIKNCILWDNKAVKGSQIVVEGTSSYPGYLAVSYSDVQGADAQVCSDANCVVIWGPGNIDADPCFVVPGYWADINDPNIIVEPNDPNAAWVEGDYHLFEASPCIDAGDNNAVPSSVTTDLDGNPRFVDDPDIPDTGNGTPPIVDMGAYEYNPPVAAEVHIEPETFNLQSKGVITAFIELPEPYSVEDIEADSLLCQGAGAIRAITAGDILIVKFGREELQELQADEEVELLVSGELADGTRFEGTDVIRVIDKAGKKKN